MDIKNLEWEKNNSKRTSLAYGSLGNYYLIRWLKNKHRLDYYYQPTTKPNIWSVISIDKGIESLESIKDIAQNFENDVKKYLESEEINVR